MNLHTIVETYGPELKEAAELLRKLEVVGKELPVFLRDLLAEDLRVLSDELGRFAGK